MIKLQAGFLTDIGLIREENEDSVWSEIITQARQPPFGLFVVCDGMGGHMGGKFASYWAVEAIKSEVGALYAAKDPRATVVLTAKDVKAVHDGTYVAPKPKEVNLEELTLAAIQKANKVVYEYTRHKPKTAANAGTTITMMMARGSQAVIANIGDSRTYLLRKGELTQVTRDHSLVASLVEEGQITKDEIYSHPRRNMIYRFVGQKGEVQVDLFHQELKAGDRLLLCSDGLWEMIRSDEAMGEILGAAESPQAACQTLVEAARQGGGEDNISAVVVQAS